MVRSVFIHWPSLEWDSVAVPPLQTSPCNPNAMLLEGAPAEADAIAKPPDVDGTGDRGCTKVMCNNSVR
jgi:hypothetical protein